MYFIFTTIDKYYYITNTILVVENKYKYSIDTWIKD